MVIPGAFVGYIRDWLANVQFRARLKARLAPGALGLSPLARAVEDRLLKVLRDFPRRARDFTITQIERLDPADGSHGTWRLALRSLRRTRRVLSPGDMIYLAWENRPSTVEALICLLGAHGRERVRLGSHSSLYQPRMPRYTTLRRALSVDLDCEMASIALLRWAGLESQAHHNEEQDAAHDAYHARLMETMDWSLEHPPYRPLHFEAQAVLAHGLGKGKPRPSPQEFLDLLEPAGGRSYTITGSSRAIDGHLNLDITVSQIFRQVEIPGGGREVLPARASHFLLSRKAGDRLSGWILPDSHTLEAPVTQGRQCLVICTGSGISGFLSLARSRDLGTVPRLWLVYGVRSWKNKSLYGSELEAYRANGILSRMDLAISRPLEGEGSPRHVQDLLWEVRRDVAAFLAEGGAIFVCGSQSMGDQVRAMIKNILQSQGTCENAEAAEAVLADWEKTLRYQASVSGV